MEKSIDNVFNGFHRKTMLFLFVSKKRCNFAVGIIVSFFFTRILYM